MKIRVTLKDPDTMHDAVHDAAKKEINALAAISDRERKLIFEERASDAREAISAKWMPYGEYLTVDFDTETGTATVVPASEFK